MCTCIDLNTCLHAVVSSRDCFRFGVALTKYIFPLRWFWVAVLLPRGGLEVLLRSWALRDVVSQDVLGRYGLS